MQPKTPSLRKRRFTPSVKEYFALHRSSFIIAGFTFLVLVLCGWLLRTKYQVYLYNQEQAALAIRAKEGGALPSDLFNYDLSMSENEWGKMIEEHLSLFTLIEGVLIISITAIAFSTRNRHEKLQWMVAKRTTELSQELEERERTIHRLQESEERYRKLVELSPNAIFVQTEGNFSFINPAGLRLLGAKVYSEILGKPIMDRVHPDYRRSVQTWMEQLNPEKKEDPRLEGVLLRLDGSPLEVDVMATPLNYQGQMGALVLAQDITARRQIEDALRESQQYFRILVEQSPVGILLWRNQTIIYANPRFIEMFAYSFPEEIINRSIGDFIAPEQREMVIQRAISREAGFDTPNAYEAKALQKGGAHFDIFIQVAMVVLKEGKTFLGFITDISERKKSEQQVLRYKSLAENTRDIIWFVRYADGQILEGNQAACKTYGYSADEIKQLNIKDLRSPDTYESLTKQLFRANAEGHLFETTHIRKNGEQFPVEVNAQGVVIDGEKALLSIIRDITERKQAEAALHRQIEETRKRTEELEVLGEVSSIMRLAKTRTELIRLLIEQSLKVMEAQAGALALINGNSLVFQAQSCTIEQWAGKSIPRDQSSFWKVIQQEEALFYESCSSLSPSIWPDWMLANPPLFQACVLVPLKNIDTTIGLLFLGFTNAQKFYPTEKSLILAIAEMAGTALHRMSISDSLEKLVAERTGELETIYHVTAAASAAPELIASMQAALTPILEAIHTNHGAILLFDPQDAKPYLVVEQNLSQILQELQRKENLEQWIFEHRQPFICHLQIHQPENNSTKGMDFAALPMRVGNRVVGVLEIGREESEPLNLEEITLLSFIADHLALVVDNARLLFQTEQNAVSSERSRMARELHDSVTQMLYSATLFAEGGRRSIEQGEIQPVKEYLAQLGLITQQALKEMRLMVYELRSPDLNLEDLPQIIRKRLDSVEIRAGVQVDLKIGRMPSLTLEKTETIYRIILEALNNSLKHSKAQNLTVAIQKEKTNLVLRVKDDGQGFIPSEAAKSGGLGLTTMKERAELCGGQVRINSHPGKGTEIVIHIPLTGKDPT